MGSPLEGFEQKNVPPSTAAVDGPFDPIGLLAGNLTSERTLQVLGTSAAGGLSAATAKLGVDYYASRNSWMHVTESTFQSSVSNTAPGWAKTYLEHGSPSAAVAREAAGNVKVLSSQLASEAKDFAAGARFFGSPPTGIDAVSSTANYLNKLGDPRLAIKANAPAAEVLAYAERHVGSIAGLAERDVVLSRMAALEREMVVVQRPLFQAARTSALSGALQGAAVGGMSYVIDGQLSSAAKSYYGDDSELARVLEPTLTGAFLTGAGCALGSNLRTKVAMSAAGWLTGKAINYFGSEG